MQIVVRVGDGEREVVVDQRDPDAVVGDLLAELGVTADGIDVDGRYVDAAEGLAEAPIPDGAVITPSAVHGPVPRDRPTAPRWLTVVAGRESGSRHPIAGPGTVVVGRDPDCQVRLGSPTVSDRHALLHVDGDLAVRVEDAGSRNGTWVDGVAVAGPTEVPLGHTIRLGAVVIRVDGPDPADVPMGADRHLAPGNIPFNRPPRPALPAPMSDIDAPGEPDDTRTSQPLRLAAMVAPVLMAGVLIAWTGQARFALFALLSPVMIVGNWLSSRRQVRKSNRMASATYRADLERFRTQLTVTWRAERTRRETTVTDLGEILRRATWPTVRLWERRLHHDDAMRLRLGSADVPWQPPVKVPDDQPTEEVAEALAAHGRLPAAPVDVDLGPGEVIGIVGDRPAGLALARSLLLQATVLHGPADLRVGVFTHGEGASAWQWTAWLPHTHDPGGEARLLAGDTDTSTRMLASVLEAWRADHPDAGTSTGLGVGAATTAPPRGPVSLYVVDDIALLTGRRAPARDLLAGAGGPTSGIVLAPSEDRLPSSCTVVVDVRSDLGDAHVHWPASARTQDDVLLAGLDEATTRRAVRALAHFEDPELVVTGGAVPTHVRLLPLLGMDELTDEAVPAAWSRDLPDPGPQAPIGMAEDGPVELDLRRDGPHALVGGTTGSGKSELLRSLVAGMAARVDPDHLVFVLVDYKGGSAFDACARLPHTVGLVTDLDEHLGERALTSLEAELRTREHLLRDAGAADLPEYLAAGAPLGPLPRMVVVVDEFATMAAELPDFLEALVGVAQRGRSLGVHLVLATQRPRGAVNAQIRANTNLRIALRVQDPGDSTDIIDRPDAAELDRNVPGRAWVRRGHGDITLVQTALATAPADATVGRAVALGELRFAATSVPPPPPAPAGDGPTDLTRLVTACRRAFERSGRPEPRRPWLPMPSEDLPLEDVLAAADAEGAAEDAVPFAIADDPAGQTHRPVAWRPAEGHLAVFGMVGSGTTTALLAVGRAVAERMGPDRAHLYGLDFGGGALGALADLPHCGAVVTAAQRESQFRLVRLLRREVERRRELPAEDRRAEPLQVVLADGIAAFLGEHEGVESQELVDDFRRVFQDGPQVGVVFVVTGERPAALPMRLGALVNQKVLLRHADPTDFGAIGVRPGTLPKFVPGRGLDATTSLVVQIGHPGDLAGHVARLAQHWPPPTRTPRRVEALPTRVPVADLAATPSAGPPIRLPMGLADDDLAPAELWLHPGDHVLVAGPPRSGKSSLLQLLSAQLRTACPDAIQVALCEAGRSVSSGGASPTLHGWPSLDAAGSVAGLTSALRAAATHHAPWVVLVDDAPQVDDPDGLLAGLLTARPDLHVVAAGRIDDVRSAYGHWTRSVRQSRTGALLQPNLAADGDLFSLRLPRRVPVPLVAGRGFLVNGGEATLAHFALPPADPPPGTIRD